MLYVSISFLVCVVAVSQATDTCPAGRKAYTTSAGTCGHFYNKCPDTYECMDSGLCCGPPGSANAARRTTQRPRSATTNRGGGSDLDSWEDENINLPACEDTSSNCFWRTAVGRCSSSNAKKKCKKTCGHCPTAPPDLGNNDYNDNNNDNNNNRNNNNNNNNNWNNNDNNNNMGGGGSNEPCGDKSWKCFWRTSVGRCNSANAMKYCKRTCGHCPGQQQNNGGGGGGGANNPNNDGFVKPEGTGCVRPCLRQFMSAVKSMNPGKICHAFRQVEWCVNECPKGWIMMKVLGPQLKALETKVNAVC